MEHNLAHYFTTEPYKTLITFGGTLFITMGTALLTVYLALLRFKSERLWDKRLSVYSDLVEALSEMYRVNSILWDRLVKDRADNEEYEVMLNERYRAAARKFESAAATARLLLGPEVERAIKAVEDGLEASKEIGDYSSALDEDGGTLRVGRDAILALARATHNTN